MASDDRFYLLEMSNRPAFWGDIGNLIKIEGIVVGGNDTQAVLLLPSAQDRPSNSHLIRMSEEEWSDFIRRSDDPEILIGNAKIFQRKLRYEISGAVQQKVWSADGFKCMYCGAQMGKSPMTIDHFIPLELGGENNEKNYLTSCKRCNKAKGSQDPEMWCKKNGLDIDGLKFYLQCRKLP